MDAAAVLIATAKVRPGMDAEFTAWTAHHDLVIGKFPGFVSSDIIPPTRPDSNEWTTIMRFDSASHLEGWINAPERKEMLTESKAFIEHEQLTRLATSFPGWFPTDPKTGHGPPKYKAGMLVLLGLFPIVMLEARFLNPRLASLNFSLGMFIGNVLSVAATTYLTMPLFIKALKWWLLPEPDAPKSVHWKGTLLVFALYALSVAIFWKFV